MAGVPGMKREWMAWLTVAVVVIGIVAWRLCVASISDDFPYAHCVTMPSEDDFWDIKGSPIVTWGDAVDSSINHWKIINGRLANIMMLLSQPLPAGMTAVLHGLAAGATLLLMLLCAGGRKVLSVPWLAAVLGLVMWKWLPWSDTMVSSDYYFNYVWSGVAAMGYAFLFLTGIGDKQSIVRWAGLACIGFVAGWMHEGFGIPLCAASLAVVLSDRRSRRVRLWMFAFLAVGTVLSTFAPSTLARAGNAAGTYARGSYVLSVLKLLGRFYPLYLYGAVMLALWWHRGREAMMSQLRGGLFWLVAAGAGVAIAVVLQISGRALWLPCIALTILTMRALCDGFESMRRPGMAVAAVSLVLTLLFLVELVHWQSRVSEGQREVLSQVRATQQPVAYVDLVQEHELPWWTLGIIKQYDSDPITSRFITCSELRGYDRFMTHILPQEWRGVPFGQWPKVPGDNPFRGEYPNYYSRDSIAVGTLLNLKLGRATPSCSPPAKWLRLLSRRTEAEAVVAAVSPCLTIQGDTIYHCQLYLSRPAQNSFITAIERVK